MLSHSDSDRRLLDLVHPPEWQNPSPKGRYNLVVLGAGTAGLVTAAGAAGLGARVALVERAELGGDCLNVGCVPSKSLLRSAHAAAELREAEALGVRNSGGGSVDFAAAMDRMRAVRARIAPNDSAARFSEELGVDVFFGEGRFSGRRQLEVAGQTLNFRKAVIATGARAAVPPIPGLEEAGYLTNENVFDLEELPARLLVLGGGPLGCELAQSFARMGARVTLVELADQFLPREDPEAAQLLFEQLERDGVEVRLSTSLARVQGLPGGEKNALLARAGSEENVACDQILVAVGRAPNVNGIGLEAAGVVHDRVRGVHVDDTFCTANPNIYAAGDVCMAHKFTHAADFAARAVIQNALFAVGPFGRKKHSDLTIPWCTYTDPEIAQVGLGEAEAAEQGIEIETFTRPFSEVDRAIADGRDAGFVKIRVARGSDRILGATVAGYGASDLIGEIAVAQAAGLGLGALAAVIHPYPSRAEAIRQLGDAYNRTRLTPLVKRLFKGYLDFLR
ncbi:MAG: mercuric reductase [Myxococcota bacterium]|nr:mercuric reductase [Myxococcota bacterium]